MKLEFAWELAQRVDVDDPETEVITSRKMALHARRKIGAPKAVKLGGERRCPLRIE